MEKAIAYIVDGIVTVAHPALAARRLVIETEATFELVDIPPQADGLPSLKEVRLVPSVSRDETDDELLAWVASRDVPAGVGYKIVPVASIPENFEDYVTWFESLGPDDGVGIGAEAFDAQAEAARLARNDALEAAAEAKLQECHATNAAIVAEWNADQADAAP